MDGQKISFRVRNTNLRFANHTLEHGPGIFLEYVSMLPSLLKTLEAL